MFACPWFEALVLVSCVAKTAYTSTGQKVPFRFSHDISQADAETILRAQTSLRRYLISGLAEVRERIIQLEGFDSVVGGIIQDLQTRDLDPFKSLRHSNDTQDQLPTSLVSEVINSLQVGGYGPIDWNSEPQDIRLSPGQLRKIQEVEEPFVDLVLRGIQSNSLKPNSRLLGDILYNFRFWNYSPELTVFLENINQSLAENAEDIFDFQTDPTSVKRPGDVLSDILKFISRKKQSDAGLVYQIGQLVSAIGDKGNTIPVKDTSELFDLMLEDDYPPDIIQAKKALSLAVRKDKYLLESIKGNPPMEKLLMVMAKLSGSSFSQREVHAVYPHVKLRYLTNKGMFFRPRTAADVTFLLNSFLTVETRLVLDEIQKIFTRAHWEEVLKDFDYSRYSKPRPLVVDMIKGLLGGTSKLPLCSIIILEYFLRKNRQVSGCPTDDFRVVLSTSSPTVESLTGTSDFPVALFRSGWETSTPERLSATTQQPSPPTTSSSEELQKSDTELSSSVPLAAWLPILSGTTTYLPSPVSASSEHSSQLHSHTLTTDSKSPTPVSVSPSPDYSKHLFPTDLVSSVSPTKVHNLISEFSPPHVKASCPVPCGPPESSTSTTTFSPLRRILHTTQVVTDEEESSLTENIATAQPSSVSMNLSEMEQQGVLETTPNIRQQKETTTWLPTDEYPTSEGSSVDVIGSTSEGPLTETDSQGLDSSGMTF